MCGNGFCNDTNYCISRRYYGRRRTWLADIQAWRSYGVVEYPEGRVAFPQRVQKMRNISLFVYQIHHKTRITHEDSTFCAKNSS
jgi:hypothetical protein